MSGSSEQQPVSPVGDPLAASSSGLVVREDRFFINAKVVVYAALSGMVSFLPDGTIYGCNHHFAVMLFGYSQEELLKKVRVVICINHCRRIGGLVKVVTHHDHLYRMQAKCPKESLSNKSMFLWPCELLPKLQDITLLIPDFYNHINYVDDRNMPLPPLDEEEVFHDVMERSFTPDSALEVIKNWNTGQ